MRGNRGGEEGEDEMRGDRDADEIFAGVLEEDANDPFFQHDYDAIPDVAEFVDGMQVVLDRERRAHAIVPEDDLARLALTDQAEAMKIAAAAAAAPRIDGAPPSAMAAIMGGTVAISSTDPTPITAGSWKSSHEAEARPVTVSAAPLNRRGTRAFLSIQYGTDRGVIRLDVDIGTGVTLAVPCSSIEVFVGLDAGGSGGAVTNVPFVVTLAFGRISRTTHLTRTGYIDAIPAAGTTSINRPMAAVAVVGLNRTNPATDGFTMSLRDDANNVVATQAVAAGAYLTAPIYLSGNVNNILVTNDGSSTNTAELIFGLSVG